MWDTFTFIFCRDFAISTTKSGTSKKTPYIYKFIGHGYWYYNPINNESPFKKLAIIEGKVQKGKLKQIGGGLVFGNKYNFSFFLFSVTRRSKIGVSLV